MVPTSFAVGTGPGTLVALFFFFSLHCISFFCTKSWAMVPTSFAVGTGPGTLVVVVLFFFFFPSTGLGILSICPGS